MHAKHAHTAGSIYDSLVRSKYRPSLLPAIVNTAQLFGVLEHYQALLEYRAAGEQHENGLQLPE
jgi:hypothetical protein